MKPTYLSGTALVTLYSKNNCERSSSSSNTQFFPQNCLDITSVQYHPVALGKWSTYRASGQSAWCLALLTVGTLGLHDIIVLEPRGNYASFTWGL